VCRELRCRALTLVRTLRLVSALIYQKKMSSLRSSADYLDNSVLTDKTGLINVIGRVFQHVKFVSYPISCLNRVLCFDWSINILIREDNKSDIFHSMKDITFIKLIESYISLLKM